MRGGARRTSRGARRGRPRGGWYDDGRDLSLRYTGPPARGAVAAAGTRPALPDGAFFEGDLVDRPAPFFEPSPLPREKASPSLPSHGPVRVAEESAPPPEPVPPLAAPSRKPGVAHTRREPLPGPGDVQAFNEDLEAVLQSGGPAVAPAEEDAKSPPSSHPHAIFDRMGFDMRHAAAFDLGAVDLESRFREFDAEIDADRGRRLPLSRGRVELDEMDIVEDLSAMADHPAAGCDGEPEPSQEDGARAEPSAPLPEERAKKSPVPEAAPAPGAVPETGSAPDDTTHRNDGAAGAPSAAPASASASDNDFHTANDKE